MTDEDPTERGTLRPATGAGTAAACGAGAPPCGYGGVRHRAGRATASR